MRVSLALLVALLAAHAFAKAPPGLALDPAIAAWFQGLVLPGTGTSCCGLGDGHVLGADEWRVVRAADHEVEVHIKDRWLPVPPGHVLKNTANPTAGAVAFIFQGRVICFVFPAMS
jgi:hypothetical protein